MPEHFLKEVSIDVEEDKKTKQNEIKEKTRGYKCRIFIMIVLGNLLIAFVSGFLTFHASKDNFEDLSKEMFNIIRNQFGHHITMSVGISIFIQMVSFNVQKFTNYMTGLYTGVAYGKAYYNLIGFNITQVYVKRIVENEKWVYEFMWGSELNGTLDYMNNETVYYYNLLSDGHMADNFIPDYQFSYINQLITDITLNTQNGSFFFHNHENTAFIISIPVWNILTNVIDGYYISIIDYTQIDLYYEMMNELGLGGALYCNDIFQIGVSDGIVADQESEIKGQF